MAAFFEAVRSRELGVDNAFVLATCSRVELYLCAHSPADAVEHVREWFLNGAVELTEHTYVKRSEEAVAHLHSVAAGLDSIMLGEHEILGQIRHAIETATVQGTAGPILDRLARSALGAGRRARRETAIGRGSTSVAHAAAMAAGKIVPQDHRKALVILGAGDTARLAALHFHSAGWRDLVVVNRTPSGAQRLASEFGGRAMPLGSLKDALIGADALVTAVHSDRPLIDASMLSATSCGKERPLVVMDLGNPRNVDPDARALPNVVLRDLDDLQVASEANQSNRALEIPRVTQIVEDEVDRFNTWLAHRSVVPFVKRLREGFVTIADAELSKHARHFREEDRMALERYTQSLLNKLLHQPIAQLKEMAEIAPTEGGRMTTLQAIFATAPEDHHAEVDS